MKEPDDQDNEMGRSDRSKSSESQSRASSQFFPRSITKEDRLLEDTDEALSEGRDSYLEDEESEEEDWEESSSSFHDYYKETTGDSRSMETSGSALEEAEEEVKKKISENFFYDYMDMVSIPFVTPDSDIPLELIILVHSFGYDCKKRANLQLLDGQTILYIAGNQLIFLDLKTKEQMYLRSIGGTGIGVIGVHPHKTHFAVAEKGIAPQIVIYEYPSLRTYRILRDGADFGYAYVDFNFCGSLLASVSSSPDYMLTIWDWKEEQPILRTKAFTQEVFKVTFNPDDDEQLTTAGSGHIKFWEMAQTFTGLKLQGFLGRFGKTTTSDIEGYMELPDGKVLSGSEWGNMLVWEAGLIKVELCRSSRGVCHRGIINQIMLDEGEVITIGSDGWVRIWDFETIDTADVIDNTGLLEIEPINELQVDKNVKLFSMIKMSEAGSNFWLAQDANGAIWKLDLSFSNITQDPECLFSFHSGAVEALAISPITYLMATTSLDCTVRIYDFASKLFLTHVKFKQGGTALAWVPHLVSFTGSQIIIGFEDGVVRVTELYDPKGLTIFAGRRKYSNADLHLNYVFKPHTARVTALAFERDGEILATGSTDKTVFFFEVEKDYKPIGYINTPGPVCQLVWSPVSHPESTLLIFCENGYVLEAPCPTIKEDVEDLDLVTYEIKDMKIKCFHFSSVKSKIMRLIEVEKRKRHKELKEKEKEERRKRLAKMEKNGKEMVEGKEEEEEEGEEEEEEPLPEIFIPSTPCNILCGFYSGPGKFWVSLGGYDSGFLYHCELPGYDQSIDITQRKDEPFDFRFLEGTDDNPIHVITFSIGQDFMFCGLHNGAIRIYVLKENDSLLTSLESYWHFTVHDNNYGCITSLCTSFDDHFLVTTGADGNIFVFTIYSLFERKESIKAKVPSPRFGIESEPVPEDIEDRKAYSIENARRKREHDKLMKEVEEMKTKKREQLKALRSQYLNLLEMNEELPKHMQFKRTDFNIDSKIRAEMNRKTAHKIQQVEKELAWEKEKHELGLKKLEKRFRDSLEGDTIVVHAIQSDHKVTSYRLMRPSKYFKSKRPSQADRRASKMERYEKEGTGRKDSQKETGGETSVPEESIIEKGKLFRPKTLSQIMIENQIEKTKKLIIKAERAQTKIQQRKKEWEELYKSKPADDYEDPKDVQAIKEAQVYMGDFNLKTAPDYKIPEHMRINAAKKEEELGQLDSMTHSKKMYFNKSILSLRDLKVAVIEEIQCLVQELKNIQSTLHLSKRIPIPQIPQIHPEEVPEKRFHYDEEILLAFKQKLAKPVEEKISLGGPMGSDGSGRGFLRPSYAKDTELTTRESLSRASRTSTFGLEIPKLFEFERAEPIDVEMEIIKRKEIKNIYMQQYLANRIKELIVTFDAELHLLRHQKLKLNIQMKLSDLNHVTLFQEMLLLKNFEKQENILQERVNSLDKEEQEMQWRINESMKEMEEKKNEITRLQDQEKGLYTTFQAALGENNKFANFLMKVLKKRMKRVKKKEVEGDAEEDEESEESSEEESSLESDEDESLSEDEVFDDSICPSNCDVSLFELALQLREKRLDIEEALVEEKKVLDNLKKEYDTLSKKVKVVATNLNAAEEDLEAYQREKQQQLNEILIVIPLKLHQIEHVIFGEIPTDLSGTLVFSNHSLSRLQGRILQLQDENSKQHKLNKEWRERRKQLIREKREMSKTIHKMEETVRDLMISKFGRVIDLAALQTLSVNTTLEELRIRKLRKELTNAREIKKWEEKIAQVRWELMTKTKEHTKKLHQMNDLCIEKKKLDSRLNTLQNQQGNAFQGPRRADIVAREKVTHLIRLQKERILALKHEISILKKKGGIMLPPINFPPDPRTDDEAF